MKTLAIAALLLGLAGCSSIIPKADPYPNFYALDARITTVPVSQPLSAAQPYVAPTLVMSAPRGAAGFDTQRMVYLRQPHQLEQFAENRWAESPARMVAPLIENALNQSGVFRAVVQTPSVAAADLRLDTEVLRLQQEFMASPSRVRFTLKATLVDDRSRQVVATREFEAVVNAANDTPYGGVVAANEAVRNVLEQLVAFSADAVRNTWVPPASRAQR